MGLITEAAELNVSTAVNVSTVSERLIALDPARLKRAKKAYTTRHFAAAVEAEPNGYFLRQGVPAVGDLVLAEVVELGSHTKLEGPHSRRQSMFVGDEIVVTYGNRYAPDQFLAEVPGDLRQCNLVAAGGVAGAVLEQHAAMKPATVIQPIGLVSTRDRVLNLRDLVPNEDAPSGGTGSPKVIAVPGTSMNSGKSTTVGCLVNGLAGSGLTVAAGKATGTGSGNDPRLFTDAGASHVLDFTDFGYPTTFRLDYDAIRTLLTRLIGRLSRPDVDVVVVEIADGVLQPETARLLSDPVFHASVDEVVFSAADALGATAGIQVLQQHGVKVAAVSGLVTASPLAAREASAVLDVPVINTRDLSRPDIAHGLFAGQDD
ncbi:DUF1611 domain-containing protein [Arthrobacter sp. JZ12]|uniref:DUF1611 domain-containing protein n=1 Tax=Arthrobacter sp. JZ12 TaxID=2654190 RepID=UPI002B48BBB7|nr:DUF1611 domain-containing protein [Arthrobacter sp. JZ12]WRH23892.1 DUF1611 domain-containing protein [Arthrobacter sp. JZ12]